MHIRRPEFPETLLDETSPELFSQFLGDEGFSCSWRTIEEKTRRDRNLEFIISLGEFLIESDFFILSSRIFFGR
jgi:hypothetical protein